MKAIIVIRYDRKGQGKPCGKGWISARKKCSKKGAQQLAADLKAGDKKAIARVKRGKQLASDRQKLRRQVEADKGKTARDIPVAKPKVSKAPKATKKRKRPVNLQKLKPEERAAAEAAPKVKRLTSRIEKTQKELESNRKQQAVERSRSRNTRGLFQKELELEGKIEKLQKDRSNAAKDAVRSFRDKQGSSSGGKADSADIEDAIAYFENQGYRVDKKCGRSGIPDRYTCHVEKTSSGRMKPSQQLNKVIREIDSNGIGEPVSIAESIDESIREASSRTLASAEKLKASGKKSSPRLENNAAGLRSLNSLKRQLSDDEFVQANVVPLLTQKSLRTQMWDLMHQGADPEEKRKVSLELSEHYLKESSRATNPIDRNLNKAMAAAIVAATEKVIQKSSQGKTVKSRHEENETNLISQAYERFGFSQQGMDTVARLRKSKPGQQSLLARESRRKNPSLDRVLSKLDSADIEDAIAYFEDRGYRVDVGKNCGPRSQPCGETCLPRRRGKTRIKCRKSTSGTAQKANAKNRAKEIARLKKKRDLNRKLRAMRRGKTRSQMRNRSGKVQKVEKTRAMLAQTPDQLEQQRVSDLWGAEARSLRSYFANRSKAGEDKPKPTRSKTKRSKGQRRPGSSFSGEGPRDRKRRKTSRGGTTIGGISIDSVDPAEKWRGHTLGEVQDALAEAIAKRKRSKNNSPLEAEISALQGLVNEYSTDSKRSDANPDQARRYVKVAGLRIGVTHKRGQFLPGETSPLATDYGWVQGKSGAGKRTLKAFIGPDLTSDRAFMVMMGSPERMRLIVGVTTEAEAEAIARAHIPTDAMGAVTEYRRDGKPCGGSYIRLSYKCHKKGGSKLQKASKAKRREVAERIRKQKGMPPLAQRSKDRGMSIADLDASEEMLRKSFKSITGGSDADFDKQTKGKDIRDMDLGELFREADRVGGKYDDEPITPERSLKNNLEAQDVVNKALDPLRQAMKDTSAANDKFNKTAKSAKEISKKHQQDKEKAKKKADREMIDDAIAKATGKKPSTSRLRQSLQKKKRGAKPKKSQPKNQAKRTHGALKGKGAQLARQLKAEIEKLNSLGVDATFEASERKEFDGFVTGRLRSEKGSDAANRAKNGIRRFRRKADAMDWGVEVRIDALQWALEAIA